MAKADLYCRWGPLLILPTQHIIAVIMSLLGTVDMVCHVHMHGTYDYCLVAIRLRHAHILSFDISAEAVAQMVAAEILAKPWSPPEWLPRHYLTREV